MSVYPMFYAAFNALMRKKYFRDIGTGGRTISKIEIEKMVYKFNNSVELKTNLSYNNYWNNMPKL